MRNINRGGVSRGILCVASALTLWPGSVAFADDTNCVAPPSGLISWWKAEGNANDSATVNNGTISGGVSFVSGLDGQAFDFDGTSGVVTIPASPSLAVQSFTVEGWIFPDDISTPGPIVEYGDPGQYSPLHLWYSVTSGGGIVPGAVHGLIRGPNGTYLQLDSPGGSVSSNQWSHVAFTYDYDARTARLFVNGINTAFTTSSVPVAPLSSTAVNLGYRLSSSPDLYNGVRFKGKMDEISIYNRSLTAYEIGAIYMAGSAGKCANAPTNCIPAPNGLVSWWRGEGNSVDSFGTNDGIFSGPSFAAGEVGQAFNFDGSANNLRIPAASSLNLGVGSGLTCEAWIKPADFGRPIFEWIVPQAYGLHFWSWPDGGLYANVVGVDGTWRVFLTSGGVLQSNLFQHVALTYDKASGIARIFRNAVMLLETNIGTFTPRTSTDLYIGYRPSTTPYGPVAFLGFIDEPSVYSRALTPDEIHAIYTAGSSGKCLPAPVPPTIITEPVSQTVYAGASATFTVSAIGDKPLRYQWLFNGIALAGQTNASMTLMNLQVSNSGNYSVTVSNLVGSQVSSNASLTVNPAPACAPPPAGLISWWPGSSDGVDIVSGNNGTLLNGTALVSGIVGKAFSFDGVSQVVQVPDAPSLNPTAALTLEGWVNVSGFSGNDSVAVAGKDNPYGARQYVIGMANINGNWVFRAHLGVPSGFQIFNGTTSLQLNRWYHVAMTYDGAFLRLFVNGVLDGSLGVTGPIITSTDAMLIGGSVPGPWDFHGLIDELSLYNRALSNTEIQSIYQASIAGKCVIPIPPSITSQPANKTATVGGLATFSVEVAGTPPFAYQWQFNGINIDSATNASLILSNVQFTQAGSYSVNVTNAAGFTSSTNALLNVVFPPATVRVVTETNAPSGGNITIPVLLAANGNENGVGFSLNFPSSLLSYSSATLGGGASGALLLINTNQLSLGRLGLAIALPTGTTFTPGTQDVVEVTFNTAVITQPGTAFLTFGDQPVTRELSDSSSSALAANYVNGSVGIAAAVLEGDVSPRPNGDSAVTISDWVLVGRYAARLDFPTNSSEFQRADCAPRDTLGDGAITVIDWVQAGRYAAGLDPMTVAGGPTNQIGNMVVASSASGVHKLDDSKRQLLVTSGLSFSGQTLGASVELVAQGNENALGFSLGFDSSLLKFVGASLGANASGATFDINTNQVGSGEFGMVLALPTGASFPVGTQEVVRLSFQALSTNSTSSPVTFGDMPIPRQVSDPNASALVASYANAAISINPRPVLGISKTGPTITLTWPGWATNYVLQSSDSVSGSVANWSNAPVTVSFTNGTGSATLAVPGSTRFYRLFHQ